MALKFTRVADNLWVANREVNPKADGQVEEADAKANGQVEEADAKDDGQVEEADAKDDGQAKEADAKDEKAKRKVWIAWAELTPDSNPRLTPDERELLRDRTHYSIYAFAAARSRASVEKRLANNPNYACLLQDLDPQDVWAACQRKGFCAPIRKPREPCPAPNVPKGTSLFSLWDSNSVRVIVAKEVKLPFDHPFEVARKPMYFFTDKDNHGDFFIVAQPREYGKIALAAARTPKAAERRFYKGPVIAREAKPLTKITLPWVQRALKRHGWGAKSDSSSHFPKALRLLYGYPTPADREYVQNHPEAKVYAFAAASSMDDTSLDMMHRITVTALKRLQRSPNYVYATSAEGVDVFKNAFLEKGCRQSAKHQPRAQKRMWSKCIERPQAMRELVPQKVMYSWIDDDIVAAEDVTAEEGDDNAEAAEEGDDNAQAAEDVTAKEGDDGHIAICWVVSDGMLIYGAAKNHPHIEPPLSEQRLKQIAFGRFQFRPVMVPLLAMDAVAVVNGLEALDLETTEKLLRVFGLYGSKRFADFE